MKYVTLGQIKLSVYSFYTRIISFVSIAMKEDRVEVVAEV